MVSQIEKDNLHQSSISTVQLRSLLRSARLPSTISIKPFSNTTNLPIHRLYFTRWTKTISHQSSVNLWLVSEVAQWVSRQFDFASISSISSISRLELNLPSSNSHINKLFSFNHDIPNIYLHVCKNNTFINHVFYESEKWTY